MIKSFVNSLANFYNYYAGTATFSTIKKQKDQVQESTENADLKRDLALRVCVISQFDSKVEINAKMWAVTLIVDSSIFHARLIIEGLKEDFGPFFQIADLKRPSIDTNLQPIPHCCFFSIKFGQVYLSKQKKAPLKLTECTGKTDTWLRSREKAELMIAKIQEEVPELDGDKKEGKIQGIKHPIPFSIFGRRSIFTKEVELFETEDPKLLKIQEEDQQKFLRLYALYEDSKNYEIPPLGEFVEKPDKYLGSRVVKKVFDTLYNNDYTWPLAFVWLFSPAGAYCEFIDSPRVARDHKKYDENRKWLNLIERTVRKTAKIPDNCYTWACEKLKIIDVEVPEYASDRCIAISTLFANQAIRP